MQQTHQAGQDANTWQSPQGVAAARQTPSEAIGSALLAVTREPDGAIWWPKAPYRLVAVPVPSYRFLAAAKLPSRPQSGSPPSVTPRRQAALSRLLSLRRPRSIRHLEPEPTRLPVPQPGQQMAGGAGRQSVARGTFAPLRLSLQPVSPARCAPQTISAELGRPHDSCELQTLVAHPPSELRDCHLTPPAASGPEFQPPAQAQDRRGSILRSAVCQPAKARPTSGHIVPAAMSSSSPTPAPAPRFQPAASRARSSSALRHLSPHLIAQKTPQQIASLISAEALQEIPHVTHWETRRATPQCFGFLLASRQAKLWPETPHRQMKSEQTDQPPQRHLQPLRPQATLNGLRAASPGRLSKSTESLLQPRQPAHVSDVRRIVRPSAASGPSAAAPTASTTRRAAKQASSATCALAAQHRLASPNARLWSRHSPPTWHAVAWTAL